jgi:hypothetical protein
MNKPKKYEVVLDECLNRVFTQNLPIDYVVNDYPQWKDMLKSEIETALWFYKCHKTTPINTTACNEPPKKISI